MSKKSLKIGRLFRRKRTDGTFVDGWFFRVRRGDVEVTRKGGATKKEAQSEMERVVEDLDRQLELVREGTTGMRGSIARRRVPCSRVVEGGAAASQRYLLHRRSVDRYVELE